VFHPKRRDLLILCLALVLLSGNRDIAPVSAQPSYGASCADYYLGNSSTLPSGCPQAPSDTGLSCPPGKMCFGPVSVGAGQVYVEDKNHAGKTAVTDVDQPIYVAVLVPPTADRAFVAILQYYPPSYVVSNYLEPPWQGPLVGGGSKEFGGYYAGAADPQGKYAFKALLWYREPGPPVVWKYSEPIAFIDFCQPLNPPVCTPEFPLPLLSLLLTLAIPIGVLRSRRKAPAR
jgi:hypothetical protein